jgi:hypothetical protein
MEELRTRPNARGQAQRAAQQAKAKVDERRDSSPGQLMALPGVGAYFRRMVPLPTKIRTSFGAPIKL